MTNHLRLSLAVVFVMLFLAMPVLAQKGMLRGRVLDQSTDEGIPGVRVYLLHGQRQVESDVKGDFEFHGLTLGSDTLRMTGVGYATVVLPVEVQASVDTVLTVKLHEEVVELIDMIWANPAPGRPCQAQILVPSAPNSGKSMITGQIWAKETGHPLPCAQILISFRYVGDDQNIKDGCCTGTVGDSTGTYVLTNLYPGKYGLSPYCMPSDTIYFGGDDRTIDTLPDSVYHVDFELMRSGEKK